MADGWISWVAGGGAALLVLLVVAVLAFRSRYSRVLSDAHLDEVCATLDRLRVAACARAGEPLPTTPAAAAADPRYAETSAGLRLACTVGPSERDPSRVQHYLSMSHAERLPSEAFARFVLGLALARCGRAPHEVAAARSPNLVTHLAFELSADEHARYVEAAAAAEPPGAAAIHALRAEWARLGERVRLDAAPGARPDALTRTG